MNICLTSHCNQACPYCFSADALHSRCATSEFDLKTLAKVLDFYIEAHGTHHINLYGGEPTLHSQLPQVLDMLWDRGFSVVRLFSNGLIPRSVLPMLEKCGDRLSFCWNVNPPDLYTKDRLAQLKTSLTRLTNAGSSLGFNIYHRDYDPEFVFPLLAKLPMLQVVRIGIAHPICREGKADNESLRLKDYPKVGRTIHDFVMNVVDRASTVKHVHVDCGFAPCLFNKKQTKAVMESGVFSLGRCSDMCNMFAVLPSLKVLPCFSSGDFAQPLSLNDFSTVSDAYTFAKLASSVFFRNDTLIGPAACQKCAQRSECDGGCSGEKTIYARAFLEEVSGNEHGLNKKDLAFSTAVAHARLRDYQAAYAVIDQVSKRQQESEPMRWLRSYLDGVTKRFGKPKGKQTKKLKILE
jgi:radical SAM protein with 4Fe4S-binding SPASM domain